MTFCERILRQKKEKQKENQLELQEIPKESEEVIDEVELHQIPEPPIEEIESKTSEENKIVFEGDKSKILQEIPAPPYKGTFFETFAISDAFSELKNSVLEDREKKQTTTITPIPLETAKSDMAVLRQKQLEKDMTKVLSFLSKKISVKKLEIPKRATIEAKKPQDVIPPSSMNDILKRLINLDLNIEASAIIKADGTILASAISSRISDSLFGTIGMNLSMIGSDIIEGLDAGTLKSISLRGTDGVISLAPIGQSQKLKDMLLIILSHPKVRSGIIAFAVSIVKKQIKEYLGLQK